jgi:hypothetical protein
MENVYICYDCLEYFMAICHNVWQFVIDCGPFGIFFQCLDQEKSGNHVHEPWRQCDQVPTLPKLTNILFTNICNSNICNFD